MSSLHVQSSHYNIEVASKECRAERAGAPHTTVCAVCINSESKNLCCVVARCHRQDSHSIDLVSSANHSPQPRHARGTGQKFIHVSSCAAASSCIVKVVSATIWGAIFDVDQRCFHFASRDRTGRINRCIAVLCRIYQQTSVS